MVQKRITSSKFSPVVVSDYCLESIPAPPGWVNLWRIVPTSGASGRLYFGIDNAPHPGDPPSVGSKKVDLFVVAYPVEGVEFYSVPLYEIGVTSTLSANAGEQKVEECPAMSGAGSLDLAAVGFVDVGLMAAGACSARIFVRATAPVKITRM